jgi:branched-chain amino acid aminotransferase
MHWYLADEQARLVDPKASALLLDRDDNITETATANIFIIQHGRLVTPTARNTLHGISQQVVTELAEQLELRVEIRDFQTYDVVNADEVFTSSTPYCILPVTKINGKPIGTGEPGQVFQDLLRSWGRLVNLDIAAQMQSGALERKSAFELQT